MPVLCQDCRKTKWKNIPYWYHISSGSKHYHSMSTQALFNISMQWFHVHDWPCSESIFLISFAVVLPSSVIFSFSNLLPSAVMFDFLHEPSFLPIVPHSVYLRNLWIPCIVSGRFSFAKLLAIVGACNLPYQRKIILCHYFCHVILATKPTKFSSLPKRHTQLFAMRTDPYQHTLYVCNFVRSKPQLRAKLAWSSQSTNFTW